MIKSKLKKGIPYLFIVIAVLLILLPQINHRFFLSGMDYYFHMSRTYETAMQIKTGHFSYFLSLFSWRQNARILNAMYGPVGGYLSGLLLLVTRTWLHWEISFNAIVLLIAGTSMHQLNRYWHVQPVIDLLTTVLYMISPVIINFVFYQSFYSVGAAFMPWVFLAGSRISNGHFRIVRLTAIMVMIAEVHLLTLMISVIVLAAFILPTLFMNKRRMSIFIKLAISTVLTLILTFNVWGSLLDVFLSNKNHLLLTYPNVKKMNGNPFNTITKMYPHTSFWQSPSIIGPFVCVIIILTIIFWLYKVYAHHLSLNIIMTIGIIFLWLSSKCFPWDMIQDKIPAIDTVVQFPVRFLSVGLVAIYLGLGKIVTDHRKALLIPAIILLLLTVSSLWKNNYQTTMQRGHHFYSSAVIDWRNMNWNHKHTDDQIRQSLLSTHPDQFIAMLEKPVPDYLPTAANYTDYKPNVYIKMDPYDIVHRQLLFHYRHTYSYKVSLQHRAEETISINSTKDQIVHLPFVKYQHTVVMFNGHRVNPVISRVGAIYLRLKPGRNHIAIYYQPGVMYQTGMWISLVVWILMIILIILLRIPNSWVRREYRYY